jgi:hypothetical protein
VAYDLSHVETLFKYFDRNTKICVGQVITYLASLTYVII